MKKSLEIAAISEKIMSLLDEHITALQMTKKVAHISALNEWQAEVRWIRSELQAFADEYAVLKYCYSPHSTCKIIEDIDHV